MNLWNRKTTTLKTYLCTALGLLWGLASAVLAQAPVLIINEDNDHYFKQPAERMTEASLQAYIDQFAGTRVTHFFMCPNGQRTSYRSSVHEAIWDDVGGLPPTNVWCVNAKLLHDRGIDPYKVWIARCRERRISPWLTMRMNDVHFVTVTNYFRNTEYWRNHPDLWRVPHAKSGNWTDYAFDYSKPEVREHHLALVRELLDRYDPDGLELDWMRFCYHLTPGKEREQADILTAFTRQVRELTDAAAARRGHAIRLSARVPSHPDAAAGLGMDGVAWAKQGLVDLLVASPFFSSSDYDIPVDLWRVRLGAAAANVPVVPAIDNGTAAFPGATRLDNDLALYRGWAAALHRRGAESFYLFNTVYHPLDTPLFRPLLEAGLTEETVLSHARRHPAAYRDTVPKDFPNGAQLPVMTDKTAALSFDIGRRPTSGKVALILALAERPGVKEAEIAARLNGVREALVTPLSSPRRFGAQAARALRFDFAPQDTRDGQNTVEISASPGSPQQIIWAEIAIDPMLGLDLVWQDEFNGSADDLAARWSFQNGPSGHILCSRWRENALVTNGICRLLNKKETRAGQDWTSASVWTKKTFQYGYFECRYRYGGATGLNNSFWLMTQGGSPQTPGRFEIDINEGHFPNEVNMNIHNWSGKHWSKSQTWKAEGLDLSREWHVYGLDWSERELVWTFDGQEIRRETNAICHAPAPVLLSSAIIKWAGPVTDAIDGTSMDVDYVRVYQRR